VHRGELVINAWGRLTDFPLLDEVGYPEVPPTRSSTPPRLHFPGEPRLVRTRSEVPLWNAASAKAMALGRIEADTETYVLDVVAGWAYVLPKSLAVVPCGDEHFWVKAADLGL
jgi:hypothetical protein